MIAMRAAFGDAGFGFQAETSQMPSANIMAIETLCQSACKVQLADKAALYSQGEPSGMLFLILDGFVKTMRLCEDGTQVTLELLKCGDIAVPIPIHQFAAEYQNTAWAIGNV